MPLDKRLNKDIHESVNKHYVLTNDMAKEYARRFGLETPRQVSSSYRRIWDPDTGVAPSAERVAQDVLLVWNDAIPRIIKGRGICLDDNTIKGNRNEQRTDGERNMKWGGSRKRKLPMNSYGGDDIHVDANAGIQVKIEKGKTSLVKVLAEQARKLTELKMEVLEASTLSALGYELNSLGGGDESVNLILVDRDAELDVEENISTVNV